VYVYREIGPDLFAVGFYDPSGKWHEDTEHRRRETAAKRVAWLNGASAPPIPEMMTTNEAAAVLCMQPQTLRKWAMNEDGPVIPLHVAGRLLWRVSDLLRVLGD
jgi:hypothetical protein